jgi:hypothetical protein
MTFPHDSVERGIALSTCEPAMADALRDLARATIGGAKLVPLPTTSFVAPGGNNGTALRGQIEAPYLTVSAAIAAAQSGDAIYVSPGTYPEDLDIPVLNPSITDLTIFGAGRDSQISTITWVTAGKMVLRLAGLCLFGAGASGSLAFSNNADPNCAIDVRDVTLVSGGTITSIVEANLLAVLTEATLSIQDCTSVFVGGGSRIVGGLQMGYSTAATQSLGQYTVKETTCFATRFPSTITALQATGHPNLYVDPSVRLIGLPSVTNFPFPPLPGVESFGSIFDTEAFELELQAWCDNSVFLNFDAPSGRPPVSDLSRGRFLSDVTAAVRVPTLTRPSVIAREASFEALVTAGESCDIDVRESFFLQANLRNAGANPGTIDRDHNTTDAVSLAGGPGVPVAFLVPYPTGLGNADFNAITNPHGTIQAVAATGFSGAGYNVTGAANSGTVDVTVVRT